MCECVAEREVQEMDSAGQQAMQDWHQSTGSRSTVYQLGGGGGGGGGTSLVTQHIL